MRLAELLAETVLKTFVWTEYDDEKYDVTVYANPSTLELKRILRGYDMPEEPVPFMILEDGRVLFWTQNMVHPIVIDELGVKDTKFIPCRGIIEGRDIEVWVTDSIEFSAHTIRALKETNPEFLYDIRPANCMVRRTPSGPQLVITDPLYSSGIMS